MRLERINPDPVGFSRLVKEPAFRIFTSEDEIKEFYQVQDFTPSVDLKNRVAIGVFRGVCKSGGYSVRIKDVRVAGREVIVRVAMDQPKPWQASITVLTTPQDIVTVDRKPFSRGGFFKFKFTDLEGNILHETEVFFPRS